MRILCNSGFQDGLGASLDSGGGVGGAGGQSGQGAREPAHSPMDPLSAVIFLTLDISSLNFILPFKVCIRFNILL